MEEKRMRKFISLSILTCMLLAFFISCNGDKEINEENAKYDEAISLINSGNIDGAYEMLKTLGDYEPAVKTLARFRYVATEISFGKFDNSGNNIGENGVYTLTLNENGLPAKRVVQNSSDGKTFEYYYDSNGNLVKETETSRNGKTRTYEYTYDSNGNKIKEVETDLEGNQYINEYVYDEKDNLTKRVEYSASYYAGRSVFEYTYDAAKNKIKEIITYYSEIAEPYTVMIDYTYDAKGNLVKESRSNGNVYDYTYDNVGNLIKKVYTDENGYVDTDEYFYDERGNLLKHVSVVTDIDWFVPGTSVEEYVYDANDRVTKYVYVQYDGDKYTTEYTYDVNGNLINTTVIREVSGQKYIETTNATYKLVYIPFDIPEETEELFEDFVFNMEQTLF